MWWGTGLIFYIVGEAFLYVITFGQRKPVWDIDDVPHKTREYVSMFIGFIVSLPVIIFFLYLYILSIGG